MIHKHFDSLDSTQKYLMENLIHFLNDDHEILVTCNKQTSGVGRNQNSWIDGAGSIAMSFTYPVQNKLTLIPLWIGVCLVDFLKKEFQVATKIKWPNDIYFNGKKCGGILNQKNNDKFVVVGIGLNLQEHPEIKDGHNYATDLQLKLDDKFKFNFPKKFYHYLLRRTFSENELLENFFQHALYLNSEVLITEPDTPTKYGVFKGIGEHGEALLQTNTELLKIYNGTMRPVGDRD